MTFYKEKIQKQLKKTVQNFNTHQSKASKTRYIQKQGKTKRLFKCRQSFQQQLETSSLHNQSHVLNFFNLLTVNQTSIRNPMNRDSFIQTNFYDKIVRKVEVKQNYIILYLNDSGLLPNSVQETLIRYQQDQNINLRIIGSMLYELSQKMDLLNVSQVCDISLTTKTYQLLDTLGSNPFICKIFSEKIIISKSLLNLQDYDSESFVLESIKYKFPLFQCLSAQSYFEFVKAQIRFYSALFDVLHQNTSMSQFLGSSSIIFKDTIISKNNMEHQCSISLSMPIPLVELIQIKKILKTTEKSYQPIPEFLNDSFRHYQRKLWKKECKTLQNIVQLSDNYLPENIHKIASYQTIKITPLNVKQEQQQRRSPTSYYSKNSFTDLVRMEVSHSDIKH